MAVIINDFEIAVEAPEPPPPDEGGQAGAADAAPRPPTPEDIVSVLEWSRERLSRVDAT